MDILKIKDADKPKLAWIHSNKFITAPLFGLKYSKGKDERGFAHILERMHKQGLLHRIKSRYHGPSVYYLTGGALRALSMEKMVLVRHPLPVKINWGSHEHDRKVTALRIQIEHDQDLKDLFWVSDFEIRSGITPEVKADFLKGDFEPLKWRYNRTGKKPKKKRTPDAYFEATLEGIRYSFILEFVRREYNSITYDDMINELQNDFPKARRLVVYENDEAALKGISILKRKARNKNHWYVSDYQRVLSNCFKEAWFRLSENVE